MLYAIKAAVVCAERAKSSGDKADCTFPSVEPCGLALSRRTAVNVEAFSWSFPNEYK